MKDGHLNIEDTEEFRKKANKWAPFVGAGINIKSISKDFRRIVAELKSSALTENINGSHFGGSIYSLTDPFYGLMISKNLGADYIVWDKEANIKFKRPGTGTLTVEFNISAEELKDIKEKANSQYKVEPKFKVKVKDDKGNIVAIIDKIVYIRRKDKKPKV